MKSKVSAFLSETIDATLQTHLFAPQVEREFASSLAVMTEVNKAHVLMLARCGIIAPTAAAELARTILRLAHEGPTAFRLSGALEDSYFNYEARVIELAGADVGGRMHTARSRNDLKATQDRMRARDMALAIMEALTALRATMLRQAESHAAVIMPGYTHLQPAQPITFGWFLLGILHALERDHRRFAEIYPRTNLNPLGAGAVAGTSFPIDRAETQRLLGFDGLAPHAQDAIASRDYLIELVNACTLLATTWGRLAQDFFVMTSYEFGTLDLPDSIAGTSSMMPQKKNMVVLEDLKCRSAQFLGAAVTALAGVKGTTFTNTVDGNRGAFRWCWDAFAETIDSLIVTEVVVAKAKPNEERMRTLVEENFSTATDLADALVQEAGLSFREAHHVVGGVVRAAMERGLKANRIDGALLESVGREITGRPVKLSVETLRASLDPALAAERRQGTGGPAAGDIDDMIRALGARLDADSAEVRDRKRRLEGAKLQLDADFAALAAED